MLSILIRCSDDFRLFDLLNQLQCSNAEDIIVSMTPNFLISKKLEQKSIPYVITEKGNLAVTTTEGLKLCKNNYVLLLDSDCLLQEPVTVKNFIPQNINEYDILNLRKEFLFNNLSSFLTSKNRGFQYSYYPHVYEPGLIINKKKLHLVFGEDNIFYAEAPYTPDGVLDYLIRNHYAEQIKIRYVPNAVVLHRELGFVKHLRANMNYGWSDAIAAFSLSENILEDYFKVLLPRKIAKLCKPIDIVNIFVFLICDIVYLCSFIINTMRLSR